MIEKLINTLFLCLIFMVSNQVLSAAEPTLQIPDSTKHESFLLESWKPGKPSLVVFKDPSCPYCIRDLKKRNQLENYNVFLFWSPILGDRSIDHVNAFFKCPSSSDIKVIDAVIRRVMPDCDGPFNDALFRLNNNMVENYDPDSVPQYWLGGRQVSLANLNLYRSAIDAERILNSSSLKIDWSRYQSSSINLVFSTRNNIGIVLPEGYLLTKTELETLASDERYNWYLFGIGDDGQAYSEFLCRQHSNKCLGDLPAKLVRNNMEFSLLTGLDTFEDPRFVFEGKELVGREKMALIPRDILLMLSKK